MFIWGWSTKSIGNHLTNLQCSHCQQSDLALVAFQKFFDVFFLPTIPLVKEQVFMCPKCEAQFQVNSYDLDPDSLPKVKTPWWGFSGLFVTIALVIGVSTLSAFEIPKEKITPETLAVNDIAVIKNNDEPDFPYSLIKISQIDDGKIIYNVGKYGYSTSYQAQKAARRDHQGSFSDDTYEASIEDFKKYDIDYVKNQN